MNEHARIVRDYLLDYVPAGFRDDDGVWHDGPHRIAALAALDALLAEQEKPTLTLVKP